MPSNEMPIFTRTFDLLAWLLPATNHFPRAHRHTVTRQLCAGLTLVVVRRTRASHTYDPSALKSGHLRSPPLFDLISNRPTSP